MTMARGASWLRARPSVPWTQAAQAAQAEQAQAAQAQPRPKLLTRTLDLLLRRTTTLRGEQQSRLFRVFSALQHEHPQLLPGVSRLVGTDQHFLLTEFASVLLRRYDGFEFAVFDARSAIYYRMPGAIAGGNGDVAPGGHALRLDHWNLQGSLYLRLDKTPGSALRVSSAGFAAEPGVAYRRLDSHHLDHAKLCIELEEQVHRCLVWYLLSFEHMPALVAALDRPTLRRRLDDCATLGPRLAGVAADCRKRLTPAPATSEGDASTRSPL